MRNAMERLVMLTGESEISEKDTARALWLDKKQTVCIPEREEGLRGEVELAESVPFKRLLGNVGGIKLKRDFA